MNTIGSGQSNCRRLAVPVGMGIALAMFLLIALSSAQADRVPPIPSSSPTQGTADLSSGSVITIGVAAALNIPRVGWPQANAVQLAISQTNAAGGIEIGGITYTLALLTADDTCSPTQAMTVANTLLDAGAVAVVGHSCSSASMAAQPLYNAAGVAMISASSTLPQLTQQGYTTTFRMVTHDGTAPALLATHFRDWLGLSQSAVVDSSSFSAGDAYSSTFTTLGGTITSRRVATDTSYFTATLVAIQSENPDVIVDFYMGPDYATAGGLFSKIAYNLGMTSVVIGWNSETNDELVLDSYANAAGPAAAENDYAVMKGRRFQDMPGWATFLAAYQAAGFPNEPTDPGPLGAYAYDAARIVMDAIDRAESTNPRAILSQIAAMKNHKGVVGTYQGFDANGDAIPQWAWLEHYQNGQWVILHPTKIFLPVILKNLGQK